jgi:hypothetical protein
MAVYLLSCDLTKSDDRYRRLATLIDSNFDSQRIGRFSWAIETNLSANDLCEAIVPHVAASDRLFIVRASRDLAWSGFPPQATTWLRQHLFKKPIASASEKIPRHDRA